MTARAFAAEHPEPVLLEAGALRLARARQRIGNGYAALAVRAAADLQGFARKLCLLLRVEVDRPCGRVHSGSEQDFRAQIIADTGKKALVQVQPADRAPVGTDEETFLADFEAFASSEAFQRTGFQTGFALT